MFATYLAHYQDRFGKETTSIRNDGKMLRMTVRGVEFSGKAFDSLDPSADSDKSQLDTFHLYLGALCACEIECEIPVVVVDHVEEIQGVMTARYEFGLPNDEGQGTRFVRFIESTEDKGLGLIEDDRAIDPMRLKLELAYDGQLLSSRGQNLYWSFDEQLSEIKEQLPQGVHLKTCWSCAFSDYDVAGSGSFGSLACFRNHKEEYRKVSGKAALNRLWNQRAELVQEIHLCPEFEPRQSGAGYRYW